MSPSLISVLVNPNRFFSEKEKEPVSFRLPALIVVVNGIVAAFSAYLTFGLTMSVIASASPEAASMGQLLGAIAGLVGFIGACLMWVIFTVVFFIISLLFKGKGSFNRTLEYVGYGYLPQIFGALLGAILIYQFVSTATIPAISDFSDPAQIQMMTDSLTKNPLMQLATIVSTVFLVWSANIWIFGLKYARNLATRGAVLTVGLPVAAMLALSLYSLVV